LRIEVFQPHSRQERTDDYDEVLAKRVTSPSFPLVVMLVEGQAPPGLPFLRRIVAETGDFNRDGRSDIVWRDTSTGAVAIWFMHGLDYSPAGVVTVTTDWTFQGLNAD
jgi:hypothetical protein